MNKLEIENAVYYYNFSVNSYYTFDFVMTNFHIKKTKYRKKYYLFGNLIEVEFYDPVFSLNFDIHSNKYSKKQVRKKILKEHKNLIRLKNRTIEINKREII